MNKEIVVDVDRCTGCGSCELICSFDHHGEFNPLKSRIHKTVFMEKAAAVPVLCYQCEDAWCARACPSGALSRGTQGQATVVLLDENRCVGCRMCTLACPFGNISVNEKGKAEKCDLCGGFPQCVEVCRYKALKYESPYQGMLDKKEKTSKKLLENREEAQ